MIKDRGNIAESMKGSGVVVPEGVSFDGSTDYLSRSSDLVGNVDSKTFTFSCWVYSGEVQKGCIYEKGTGGKFEIRLDEGLGLEIVAYNSSSTNILYINATDIPKKTFINILASVDMTNQVGSKIYVNDKLISTSWAVFTNDTIDFTGTSHSVARETDLTNPLKGRLSNVFLAYEYLDLSIPANRRIFITADGKPA